MGQLHTGSTTTLENGSLELGGTSMAMGALEPSIPGGELILVIGTREQQIQVYHRPIEVKPIKR